MNNQNNGSSQGGQVGRPASVPQNEVQRPTHNPPQRPVSMQGQSPQARPAQPNGTIRRPVQAPAPQAPRQGMPTQGQPNAPQRPAAMQGHPTAGSIPPVNAAQRPAQQGNAPQHPLQSGNSVSRPIQAAPQPQIQRPAQTRSAQQGQPTPAPVIRRAAVNQSAKAKSAPAQPRSSSNTRIIEKDEIERQQALLLKQARQKSAERYDSEDDDDEEEYGSSVSNAVKSIIKAVLYIVLVAAVAGILSYYVIEFGNDMYAFVKSDEQVEIEIPEYATVEEISTILGDSGVIKYPNLMIIYSKLKNIDETYNFKAGTYTVNGMMNYDELLLEFVDKPSTETVRITIPEGYTVDEMITLFTENGIGTREGFIDVINNYDFDYDFVRAIDMSKHPGRIYRLEGYLYPDTYDFYVSSKESVVINKMLRRFDQIFSDSLEARAQEMGMTIDEVMNLASLIEKEGRYSADYEMISSVFHNRLNNSANYPKLESDATIMYAIQVRDGERKNALTKEDLEYDTPYNSYLYDGLPPGPIANPGYEAITCALYPANSKYYFFVSDNYGNTYYGRTLAEHNQNRAKVDRINNQG
ncbi:MAG: endolytic transglycosylase MltG [Clostridia bacterium]|nr:endolytic transglycosylase MltG [Clostridia bacterium]